MDHKTTLSELQQKVIQFRNCRNWEQFHDPKNLSIALSIETAELQELFLWRTGEEIDESLKQEKLVQRIEEELADILIYLLYLSKRCDIDLSKAVTNKLQINEIKYPVEKSFNSHKKYNELDCVFR